MEPNKQDNETARLRKDVGAAGTQAIREGKDALKETADKVSSRAWAEAETRSEEMKDRTTEELDAFAHAVRTAGDELAKNQKGPVSDLVTQAARGLEGLSKSLQRRSTGEMLDDVRDFGRRNPGAFIAGSVLAGLALGRFAGSSASHHSADRSSPGHQDGKE